MSSSTQQHASVVQPAWDNHFAAFGSQNVDQILLDYTDESVVTVYNVKSGKQDVYKGLAQVETCFEGLFATLHDLSRLEAPVIDVNEGAVGSVFLMWKCPSSGVDLATDTFLFEGPKVAKQNVVLWTADPGELGTSASTEPTGGTVQASWDNHFSAFSEQNVEKILLDYTEESVATVFDVKTETKSTFKGLFEIRDLFTGLFADLSDLSGLEAPCVQVFEKPSNVFLIWKCPSSGIVSATDTFLFDENAKIKYQNVVVKKA